MRRLLRGIAAAGLVAVLCGLGLSLSPRSAAAAAVGRGWARPGLTRRVIDHAAVLPAHDRVTGPVAPSAALHVTLALTPRDPARLAAYARAVSDPGSPVYHHFLTVAGFAHRFGASAREVASVAAALRRQGLTPGPASRNRLSLPVSGTSSQMQRAFDTRLRRVRLAGGGTALADMRAPSLPARVAGLVQGVAGLNTLPALAPQGLVRSDPGAGAVAVPHTVASVGGPQSCAGAASTSADTAQEIAFAYGLDGLWDAGDLGAGVTIAAFELEPYTASDIAAYQSCYGTSATVVPITVAGGPATTHQSGEAALDIEDLAGLAPRATIDVYEGPNSTAGTLATYSAIVQADTAQVITTSWGLCESKAGATEIQSEATLFQEAATQGQTVLAAAGDSGANDCVSGTGSGVAAVDDPASQPYVTGVGGTSLPSYLSPGSEPVWNETGVGAGGGGVSIKWAQPSYQTSRVLAQSAIHCGASTTCREVPDVSADADPETGYAMYIGGHWSGYGGTSAAAPTWAALVALADASSYCAGHAVGFANPLLYGLSASDFLDVTVGNNGFAHVTGYSAGAGYDMASGLGAPNGAALVPAICGDAGALVNEPASAAAPPATTTTTTSPTSPSSGTASAGAPTATTPTPPTPTTTTTTASPPHRHRPAAPTVEFTPRRAQRGRVGRLLRVRLHATDRRRLALRYSAIGLPAGLRIDPRTGIVSGRPRRAGAYTSSVRAGDRQGNAQLVVIRWTIRR